MMGNRRSVIRLLTALLALTMSIPAVLNYASVVRAEDTEYAGCEDESGTYVFTSVEDVLINLEDEYVYNDEWFSGSSFTFNRQLATLSVLAAISSNSYYEDSLEKDNSKNSYHLEEFLKSLGFQNVTPNAEYNQEKLMGTAGVCVGYKTIGEGEDAITLLAVMPRSAGYKQEWAGNFTIGAGGVTEGFKAGRDEILRFVKKYISDNGISGEIKVWVSGHSRGAALANMTAAFLASGTDYFDNVTIKPENVYAYTFATPRTIIAGKATKADFLQVAGSRGGRYAYDTPGSAYTYNRYDASAIIYPAGNDYKGIHNCMPDFDIITLLPLPEWGYTVFGVSFPLTDGSAETKEKMLAYLQQINPVTYDLFIDGGDNDDYRWMTFDFDTLSIVDDTEYTAEITQASFLKERLLGLASPVDGNEDYVSLNYQTVMSAVAAIGGMGPALFVEGLISDTAPLIKGGLLTYLAYGAGYYADKAGMTENEGAAEVFKGLLSLISGEPAGTGFTVDDGMYILCKVIADGAHWEEVDGSDTLVFDSELSKTICEALSSLSEDLEPDLVYALAEPCAYGAGGSAAEPDLESARETRKSLYELLEMFIPEEYSAIVEAFGEEGTKPFIEFSNAIIGLLKEEDESIGETADRYLCQAADAGISAILESGRYDEGSAFYDDVARYGQTIKDNMTLFRDMVCNALFTVDGQDFDNERNLRNVCTLVGQFQCVASAHYNENYVAWMKAQDPAYPHTGHDLMEIEAQDSTCMEQGHIAHYCCKKCGSCFSDPDGENILTDDDILLPLADHEYGDWTVIVNATENGEGREQRVCIHNSDHIDERKFSYVCQEGGNGAWTIGASGKYRFVFKRTVGDEKTYDNLTSVLIDGSDVDPSAYTVESGSAVVTFNNDYLDNLALGDHTVTAVFTDGRVTASFKVQKDSSPAPYTGDTSCLELYAALTAVSLLAFAAVGRKAVKLHAR